MQSFDASLQFSDTELLSAIAQALPVPLFVIDADGRYLAVFGAVDRALHHDPQPLLGRLMHEVLPQALADQFVDEIHRTLTEGMTRLVEYCVPESALDNLPEARGPSGDQWYEARVCPAPNLNFGAPVVITIVSNVTERVKARELLEQLADTDELTGLLNRRAFIERAKSLLSDPENVTAALAILDIDDFKQINDTHGHAAGDAVLVDVARHLSGELRTSDLLARVGGEEFVVLLSGSDAEMAMIRMDRLRQSLASRSTMHMNKRLRVTVSTGIANLDSATTINRALHRADMALYAAKEAGKNRVVVSTAYENNL